ncbi:MAG: cyclomaltodextrinase [Candidatus Sumerlaeia bacterium]
MQTSEMTRSSIPAPSSLTSRSSNYANQYDRERAALLARREADWRNGPIVYQVIVDRFAPPDDLDAKRHLYAPPRRLRRWDEKPQPGTYLDDVNVWSHELDFWGGDLVSLRGHLDYLDQLGVDVLYLNPIQRAFTNHKYDAQDYFEVSPEYGTRADVRALAADLHARGMRLVLDGVFNHMGRSSPWFADALRDPASPWREWFFFGPQYRFGYRAWANVENLPELNLENPRVRERLWGDADSAVRGYLRDGVDGWRLDVAFDIGFSYLAELSAAAHREKPGSLVIGEVWNYPEQWSPALDATINFHTRQILFHLVRGEVSGAHAGRMIARQIEDAGLEPILKSWIVLDNHDTERLRHLFPSGADRRFLQALQFTLPGSPMIYYGTELGMSGAQDPTNRAPMDWTLVNDENRELAWTRRLVALRREARALRVGDFRLLDSERLLAFQRWTDRAAETVVVLANAESEPVTEVLAVRDSKLMNWTVLRDVLDASEFAVEGEPSPHSDEGEQPGRTIRPVSREDVPSTSGGHKPVEGQVMSGTIRLTVPPRTVLVLRPVIETTQEYSAYKRVQ